MEIVCLFAAIDLAVGVSVACVMRSHGDPWHKAILGGVFIGLFWPFMILA